MNIITKYVKGGPLEKVHEGTFRASPYQCEVTSTGNQRVYVMQTGTKVGTKFVVSTGSGNDSQLPVRTANSSG